MKTELFRKSSKISAILFFGLFTLMAGCKKKKETTPNCECPTTQVPTASDPTSVTDIDGNVYHVTKHCGKWWMSENLRTTRYNDGTAIPTGLSNSAWSNDTIGAYAIYDDLAINNLSYGKLYNWHAVHTGKLAPAGWHVATEAEWNALISCYGGSGVAGGKLKSTSNVWNSPNTGADNSSGFNGLPGGYRGTTGGYATMGNTGYWWANTERNSTQGEYTSLQHALPSSFSNGATKQFGYSVRCVKD